MVAIGVDEPDDTRPWIETKGFTFAFASDPDMVVIDQLGLRNPDARQLPLHAVVIVDRASTVLYRKVARRRPQAQELLDALDYHQQAR